MKKFDTLWNDSIRIFIADVLLVVTGLAAACHYINGTEWYWVSMLIVNGFLCSDILRSDITKIKRNMDDVKSIKISINTENDGTTQNDSERKYNR